MGLSNSKTQNRLIGAELFTLACCCGTTVNIMTQETLVPRKRGPAPTGKGTQVQVRLQPKQLAKLDAWIRKQADEPTRPEAIRRLLERALKR